MNTIEIFNARLHNLKQLHVMIPKHQFIVVTGISGSGKSSFIFDILHQEGRRLYLEAIGMERRFFNYDAFDYIQGLSPTIAVKQRTINHSNPRSVVGTTTQLLNILAVIYANEGQSSEPGSQCLIPGMFLFNSPYGVCPECGGSGNINVFDFTSVWPSSTASIRAWHEFAYAYPKVKISDVKPYITGRIDNFAAHYECSPDMPFADLPEQAKQDFLYYRPQRMRPKAGKQQLIYYGVHYILEERLKKLNHKNPEIQMRTVCPGCSGYRLNSQARAVTLHGKHIGELGKMDIVELREWIGEVTTLVSSSAFTSNLLQEMIRKIECMDNVGLSYLTLYRETPTLSGGEAQRLHMMSHLAAKLDSVIYIFDEPTAGLHETEKAVLIESFHRLKEQGNTVIVIEHDESVIRSANYIMDFGPGAGRLGGQLVYQGEYGDFHHCKESVTARYLNQRALPAKSYSWAQNKEMPMLSLKKVNTNNLQSVQVDIPLHGIIGVCGVSGSGKSSLIIDSLIPALQSSLQNLEQHKTRVSKSARTHNEDEDKQDEEVKHSVAILAHLEGAEHVDGIIVVSQNLATRHENSCVATFLGIWDEVRKLYAAQDSAKEHGFGAGSFSFNSSGACEECSGNGTIKKWFGNEIFSEVCAVCEGRRFKHEVLSVRYNNHTITDLLQLSVTEAMELFVKQPKIHQTLHILNEMGMGYIGLGQSLTTLSGGEAQRLKLGRELRRNTQGTYLYVLDEPTVGLSAYDTEQLLIILERLVAANHSVLLIEHDPVVLSFCDYIIEMGPGGGKQGGHIMAMGAPAELKQNLNSVIGTFLK